MELGRTRIAFSLLILLILSGTGDERNAALMDLISVENLKQHVRGIHYDRSPSDHPEGLEQASQYIEQELLKTGLKVWKEPFQWEGKWYNNMVAEKKGVATPDQVFIIGAHYDTVPGSPGADDNASAVAVLLELAKNFQALPLPSSVRFIAFALEEYGYVGSTHHAKRARDEGEKIAGMISLEMVGFTGPRQKYPLYIDPKYYPNVGDFIAVVANERSEPLLERARRTLRTYIPGLPAEFLDRPPQWRGNGGSTIE